ncbi:MULTISPECIES: hypothetical protein [unclassified Thiocapsa]|uniref:hypothetical protein n=1 Tax=unclassified Thiocapsa TaxID=2641286 RepID=UPI0035ADFB87
MNPLTIVSFHNAAEEWVGWSPITHLVHLAATLLDAERIELNPSRVGRIDGLKACLHPRSRSGAGGLLVIAKSPANARSFLASQTSKKPFRFRAIWIIDSFWHEWMPTRQEMAYFDFIAYTQPGDQPYYEKAFGHRAHMLSWGSDVLNLGSCAHDRPIDLLRVGRQPAAWDDDALTQRLCSNHGIHFEGRPPYGHDPVDQHVRVMAYYARTKFVIAHSNLASAANYTHPSREYITGRWTDALACGATVAGVQPRAAALLFWPGATLDLPRADLADNLVELKHQLSCWTPAVVVYNFHQACRLLDWRWRMKTIVDFFNITAPRLEHELVHLAQQLPPSTLASELSESLPVR